MKKIKLGLLLSFLYALFCSSSIFGQSDSSKPRLSNYIALNAGANIPVIPFAQPYSYSYSGNGGYTLNISGVFPIKGSYLSGILLCSYGANSFHEPLYRDAELGNYIEKSLLGGIIFSDPTNSKTFFVDFRILAGALIFSNPNESYTSIGQQGNPDSIMDVKAAIITAFAGDVGIGFKKLTKRSVLLLNFDAYFSNKDAINSTCQLVYKYANGTTQIVSTVSALHVFLLNITLGFGFKV
jgi:hypothetical protein